MSSRFFKEVNGRCFAATGGVAGTSDEVGVNATPHKVFQCSPAMATCDGMYTSSGASGVHVNADADTDTDTGVKEKNEKPTVSPSPHPEHDEELETYLRMREMKKLRDGAAAMKKVMDGDGVFTRGCGVGGGGLGHTGCDMTGDEFIMVCEELWIDFKLWVKRDENVSQSFTNMRNFVVRYYTTMLLTAIFFIWFRWYIGAGKNACAEGFGTGIFSFICEIVRNLGEIIVGIILGVGGFCTGLLPLLLGVCVYEIKNMDSDDVSVTGDEDHEKKE